MYCKSTSQNNGPSKSYRVGIVGAGAIAFGTASLVSSLGHDPMIWSPSGESTKDLLLDASPVRSSVDEDTLSPTTIRTSSIQSTGEISQHFNVRIAISPKDLIQYNDDILVLALPVNGHKSVMEILAPCIVEKLMLALDKKLQQQQQQQQQQESYGDEGEKSRNPTFHIIISSHASLGAVYFMKLLRQERTKYLQRMTPTSQIIQQGETKNLDATCDDIDMGIRITAWSTTTVTARKTSDTSVNVLTVREVVDYCTVPSTTIHSDEQSCSNDDNDNILSDGYKLCTTLFGQRFNHRSGGLLAISLSNLNPQNHLGIVLGNMSRMDAVPLPPPPFYGEGDESSSSSSATTQPPPTTSSSSKIIDKEQSTKNEPWYQGKNKTPKIGRLMEALDSERINIANAFDIDDVRNIYEHFSWSFHVPLETPVLEEERTTSSTVNTQSLLGEASTKKKKRMRPLTVSEMNQQMHYYIENDVIGPSTADSRYILEDVPYGLVLTVLLGRLVNRPATLHEAGINILSAMYGRDFMKENELLIGLGLIGYKDNGGNIPSLEKWKEMAYTGYF